VIVILEARPRELDLPVALHVDVAVRIDQDVRDGGVVHEGLDGPQAEDLVVDLLVELLPLLVVERGLRLLGEDPLREPADLLLEDLPVEGVDEREVQHVHQTVVDLALELVVLVGDEEHHRFLFGDGHRLVLSLFSPSARFPNAGCRLFVAASRHCEEGGNPTRQSRESFEIALLRSQ